MRESPTPAGKVTVAYCHGGQVEGVFADSLVRLLCFDHDHHRRVLDGGGVVSMGSGPLIASARNSLVRTFLEGPADWLLMVDSDMTFPPDVVERLLEVADPDKAPVVGALCFAGGRSGMVRPTLYRVLSTGDDGDRRATIGIIEDWPRGAVVQVDATGAACLLMHRSILESIGNAYAGPCKWFFTGVHGETEYGEDFGFCLRVAAMGKPVLVHTGIVCGHSKRHIIDCDDFDAYLARRDEVGEAGVAAERDHKLRAVTRPNRAERRAAERRRVPA